MRSLLSAVFGAILTVMGLAQTARAGEAAPPPPNQGPVYVTTYYESNPGAANQAIGFLKEYRDAARMEGGANSVQVFQETGWPSRFVTVEVWRDWAAYDAHAKAAPLTQLHLRFRPIQYGPPDARTHLVHFETPSTAPTANTIYVLSHLDVTPNQLPRLIELMKPLGEGTPRDPGVQSYKILRQAPGTGNHFRLFEVWASDRAWDAHNLAAHTQEFRNELAALLGTPYDQRKYSLVN